MEDEVIELIAQLEILQTKIRIKEQRLMEMNIVKEIELAQEKEIEVPIPPHQKLQLPLQAPYVYFTRSLLYPLSSHG
jgi:hypothetical protein